MYAIGMICLTTCTSFLLKIAGLRKNKKIKNKNTPETSFKCTDWWSRIGFSWNKY